MPSEITQAVTEAMVDRFIAAEDEQQKPFAAHDHVGGRDDFRRHVTRTALEAALASLPDRTGEPVADQRLDDLAVDRFAETMKAKLAAKRREGRGGWNNKLECSKELLSGLLREHVEKGDPVDVGNLAMMIHQRGERIS